VGEVPVVRFRYNAAAAIAGVVALIGAIPIAATRWYLAPILLVPLAVAVGAWRTGTDADAAGLRLRALLGSRFVPWSRVEALVVRERRRVYAETSAGTSLRLPAVSAADLPRLVEASGEEVRTSPGPQ
jgi:Bacterial PH domain